MNVGTEECAFWADPSELRWRCPKVVRRQRGKEVPQGLKPSSTQVIYGTAEAVPFVDCLFSSLVRGVVSRPAALLFGAYTFGLRQWWGFALLFRPRYARANLGHPSSLAFGFGFGFSDRVRGNACLLI